MSEKPKGPDLQSKSKEQNGKWVTGTDIIDNNNRKNLVENIEANIKKILQAQEELKKSYDFIKNNPNDIANWQIARANIQEIKKFFTNALMVIRRDISSMPESQPVWKNEKKELGDIVDGLEKTLTWGGEK